MPGAREAPESALTRMSTSLARDNPTHHRGQDEISIRSQVQMRGSDRGWRKLGKEGMKGRKVSAVQRGQEQVSDLWRTQRGCGVGLGGGAVREVLGQEESV